MTIYRNTFLSAGLLAFSSFISPITAATTPSGQMEEILVRADFRQSTLQSIAGSLSVLTERQIKARAGQHFEELVAIAPNVNLSSGSSRARYFQIRGIGERSQFSQPINPSVGFIIDDVDFSGIGSAATLFDVEQVEILRGPQGTRYGANALAGLINIRTNAPAQTKEFRIETSVAKFGGRSLGLVANVPLIEDSLLARLVVHRYQSDGFIDNRFLGRDDTNNRDEQTTRLKLHWAASEALSLDLSYMRIDVDNGYDAFSLDNNRSTLSDQPGTDAQLTDAVSLVMNHQISAAIRSEAIISYADSEMEYSYDEDWAFVGITGCQADWSFCEYSSFDQYLRDRNNYSLEYRLLSDTGGQLFNGSTDWVVGAYQRNQEERLTRHYTYSAGPFSSDYQTKNTALYGQLDIAINNKLTLIAGLRLERWDADYEDNNGLVIESDENLVGGKIGLRFDLSDQHIAYATLSKGYKAGGVNTDGSLPVGQRDFDTEYLWNLESGLNSHWLQQNLTTRISLFYTDRNDQQVKGSFVIVRPGMGTEFIDYIDNAASGKNYGLEAQMNWQVSTDIELFGSLGLLLTEMDNYVTPDGIDMSGRDQAHAPQYQINAGIHYQFSDRWAARLEVDGRDEFYFSNRHDEQSGSYMLLHARFSYTADSWSVALWGHNLTDKRYETRGFGFANDPRNDYSIGGYQQLGEPRVVGVTMNLSF